MIYEVLLYGLYIMVGTDNTEYRTKITKQHYTYISIITINLLLFLL